MSSDPAVTLSDEFALLTDNDLFEVFCDYKAARKRIEALEGEVVRLEKAHDERLKQNTLERAATHKQFHRAEAAEARAERLQVEIDNIKQVEFPKRAESITRHLTARAERLRVALEEIKSDPVTAVAVAERALEGK